MKQMFSENEILKMISENALSEEQTINVANNEAQNVMNNYSTLIKKNTHLYVVPKTNTHVIYCSSARKNDVVSESSLSTVDSNLYFYEYSEMKYFALMRTATALGIVFYKWDDSDNKFTLLKAFTFTTIYQ